MEDVALLLGLGLERGRAILGGSIVPHVDLLLWHGVGRHVESVVGWLSPFLDEQARKVKGEGKGQRRRSSNTSRVSQKSGVVTGRFICPRVRLMQPGQAHRADQPARGTRHSAASHRGHPERNPSPGCRRLVILRVAMKRANDRRAPRGRNSSQIRGWLVLALAPALGT